MRSLVSTFLAVLLCACPPPTGSPSLALFARPSAIDDQGQMTTLVISALDATGQPGKGNVTLTAAAGTLEGMSVTLDATGSATSHFSCTVATDSKCMGRVSVTATWNDTTSTTRVQVGDAGITPPHDGGPGAPDGGPPDGGEPDGGEDDAGETDAGFIDAGVLFAGDAGAVWLLGTLTPNASQPALASLSDPTTPAVGLPAGTQASSAQLDALGRLVYFDSATSTVRRMVLDPYEHVGSGSQYPTDPAANDPVLDTSGCEDAGHAVTGFWMRGASTSFIYACGAMGPYFEAGRRLSELDGFTVLSAGSDSVLAMQSISGETFDDAGPHGVTGFPTGETFLSLATNNRGREVRAVDGGYWVMRGVMDVEVNGLCYLYFVDGHSGAVSFTGIYADLGPATTAPLWCTGRMDSNGILYTPGMQGSAHVVVARPFVTSPNITKTAYTESGASASTFGTYPPHVFTFIDSASSLVGGP